MSWSDLIWSIAPVKLRLKIARVGQMAGRGRRGHGMRKLFSRRFFWVTIAAVSLRLHAWWAWYTRDGLQAARCGAIWVVCGIAIVGRPIIRMGYGAWYRSTKIIDGGHVKPTREEIEERRQDEIDAMCVQKLGPAVIALGTVLWAYGDLSANAIIRGLCSVLHN